VAENSLTRTQLLGRVAHRKFEDAEGQHYLG
jgi:hypothetical protein